MTVDVNMIKDGNSYKCMILNHQTGEVLVDVTSMSYAKALGLGIAKLNETVDCITIFQIHKH